MAAPMIARENYRDVGTLEAEDVPLIGRQRRDPTIVEALTDASHAQRFAEAYGDLQLKYNHRRGIWLIYHGPRWRPDSDGHVYRLALEYVRSRQAAALEITDRKLKEKILKFTIAAESKSALDKLVGLAKNFPPMTDAGDRWDADDWLSGAPNGVLDWRTGLLRPGDPTDRITRSLGVTTRHPSLLLALLDSTIRRRRCSDGGMRDVHHE